MLWVNVIHEEREIQEAIAMGGSARRVSRVQRGGGGGAVRRRRSERLSRSLLINYASTRLETRSTTRRRRSCVWCAAEGGAADGGGGGGGRLTSAAAASATDAGSVEKKEKTVKDLASPSVASADFGAGAVSGLPDGSGNGLGSSTTPGRTIPYRGIATVAAGVTVAALTCTLMGIETWPRRFAHFLGYAKLKFVSLATSGTRTTFGCACTGLAAGCLHTLAGPDHLAALAPLSIGRPRSVSMVLGALWGGGHTTGQLLVGLLIMAFRDTITKFLPILSRYGSIAVGLTLVAIGAIGCIELRELKSTGDDAGDMDDAAAVAATAAASGSGDAKKNRWLATYATGIIYGFHPDAVMLIVPALALSSTLSSAAYILFFCLGTVMAMGGYTGCIGATTQMLSKKVPKVNLFLSLISSIIAIALGLALTSAGVLGFEIL